MSSQTRTSDTPGPREPAAEQAAWPDDAALGDGAADDRAVGAGAPEAAGAEERLVLKLKSYEGPLDLLLDLARRQKVDLAEISVLELAEQYLSVIRAARRLHLELAAAWLVMAAWLAWLKSRLLLPAPPEEDDEPNPEEMALRLAFRLKRLEAMREAGKQLMLRPRLGLDVFARGMPEPVVVAREVTAADTIGDLLSAYAAIVRRKAAKRRYHIKAQPVWTIHEVREVLESLIGSLADWCPLQEIVQGWLPDPERRRSALASSFAASLELAREGQMDLRQEGHFAPLLARRKARAAQEEITEGA